MSDPWLVQRSIEREETALEDEYGRGEITIDQFNEGIRNLQRAYEDAAQEAAGDEYERWF